MGVVNIFRKIKLKTTIFTTLGVLLICWVNLIFVSNPLDDLYNETLKGNINTQFLSYVNYFAFLYGLSLVGLAKIIQDTVISYIK
jgi:uncharacterized membrane protein